MITAPRSDVAGETSVQVGESEESRNDTTPKKVSSDAELKVDETVAGVADSPQQKEDTVEASNRDEEPSSPVEIDRQSSSQPQQQQQSIQSKRGNPGQLLHVDVAGGQPPLPPKKDEPYIDPTPKTPQVPRPPADKDLPEVPQDDLLDDSCQPKAESEGRKSEDSQSEIQTIIDQFSDETSSLRQEEIMSPRLELADQFRTSQGHFPPRNSSLEQQPGKQIDESADTQAALSLTSTGSSCQAMSPPAVPPKSPSLTSAGKLVAVEKSDTHHNPSTPTSTVPPPPEPEAEQPFDFHRFLEQLRHRTADPVAKFLRSFLNEFGKRQWMVHEQVKIISDFLAFITNKMAQCEVWKGVSDVEFDNAKEGMEKLVMNRLYTQTFSPTIPPPAAPSRSRSRGRRKELERMHHPGRRGQHQEDVERDEILAQKVRIYSWVREEHLDIPPVGPNGRRFLLLAQQGLLRHAKNSDTSADSFIPLLIYVVLKANPEHLVSNVQYILRFRNQEKLSGEAGYYLSSLSGAIQFIETLDRTSLTVSDEEFERNVEAAVSAIAERNPDPEEPPSVPEKPPASRARETASRPSFEGHSNSRQNEHSPPYSPVSDDNTPVAGLLRTIQKPLTTIGRIFSDDTDHSRERSPFNQQSSATSENVPYNGQRPDSDSWRNQEGSRGRDGKSPSLATRFEAQEAAARQASAESAEARRIQQAEHNDVVETLAGMFPNLDRDLIDDVVTMKEGRVGLAVDACLALSADS
ncbi:guanine nucleotide exchange factor Vps9 [Trichophyton rubrum]|uniref:Guanine nucleotide exchange factor Vps9 n=1 Tax=Trichophyton rubrum TaxID=5551 RepID=A0A178F3T8_TRIRU|nr:guanine nucleotide exchange factor Vps9 [Trichophyton rubrum]